MIVFGNENLTIRLKNPELNDGVAVSTNLRVKTAMSGDMVTYISTPIKKRISLNFKDLTRKKTKELENFLSETFGQEMTYIDYNGVSWTGHIISDSVDFTTTGRGLGPSGIRAEANSVKLTFEGSKNE